jgi:hypothetical protein
MKLSGFSSSAIWTIDLLAFLPKVLERSEFGKIGCRAARTVRTAGMHQATTMQRQPDEVRHPSRLIEF